MARQESHREDLMREATALKRRVRLGGTNGTDDVIAGFHADGGLSLYFGADPVYHFDGSQRLKRAYISGDLYRSQGKTLARLSRVRTHDETQLFRNDLTQSECDEVCEGVVARLSGLQSALLEDRLTPQETVPPADVIVPDLLRAIGIIVEQQVALAPPFAGRH